jgi:hypothetical protein
VASSREQADANAAATAARRGEAASQPASQPASQKRPHPTDISTDISTDNTRRVTPCDTVFVWWVVGAAAEAAEAIIDWPLFVCIIGHKMGNVSSAPLVPWGSVVCRRVFLGEAQCQLRCQLRGSGLAGGTP